MNSMTLNGMRWTLALIDFMRLRPHDTYTSGRSQSPYRPATPVNQRARGHFRPISSELDGRKPAYAAPAAVSQRPELSHACWIVDTNTHCSFAKYCCEFHCSRINSQRKDAYPPGFFSCSTFSVHDFVSHKVMRWTLCHTGSHKVIR